MLSVFNAFYGSHPATCKYETANITNDAVTLQRIAKMSLRCEVLSSFVIVAVLYLRVAYHP